MSKEINFSQLLKLTTDMLDQNERKIIAIVGAPGAGKSTLAEKLQNELAQTRPNESEVVPMDGFHFDDGILLARGRRPWKGAPDTFDVSGLRVLYERLLDNDEDIAVPVFDRDLEISRGSARIIPQSTKLIITEGNYLLLDEDPWARLKQNFAFSVFVDVPEAELRRRLTERWRYYGMDEDKIEPYLENNDLPNGRTVMTSKGNADYIFVDY